MAGRKARRGGESGSFDSLLDTMTNVVGILVILLVVTQVGVRDAVRRIQWKLEDVSPARLEARRKLTAEQQSKAAALRARWEALQGREEGSLTERDRMQREVEKLREKLKVEKSLEADPEKVRQRVAALESELEKRRREAAEAQEKLATLKARLDKTPVRAAPPAKVIRLPNPRPTVPGARCVWMLCRHGRVAQADTSALRQLAKQRVESARQFLEHRQKGTLSGAGLKKWKGTKGRETALKQPGAVYDGQKVQAYFDKSDIGTRDFRLRMQIDKGLGRENLYLGFRPSGGESTGQLRHPSSRYQRALRGIDREKQFVRFLVWPDSFETYITARDVLEKFRVPAGWTLYTADQWRFASDFGIKLKDEKTPAPPPPPAPDAKPKPPPPPPNILD